LGDKFAESVTKSLLSRNFGKDLECVKEASCMSHLWFSASFRRKQLISRLISIMSHTAKGSSRKRCRNTERSLSFAYNTTDESSVSVSSVSREKVEVTVARLLLN